ncbi:MAG: OadG family protein [Anaerolineae bacterium]|nr:OadG family protein [Anaerolineae bacterium]
MSDILWQGLIISLMGMGLTFLALGLLVLVIILLDRFTRPKAQPLVSAEMVSKRKVDTDTVSQSTADETIVAAIAAALAHFRSSEAYPADLGATLEAGPGAWWTTGRSKMQSVNTVRTGRWRY